MSESSRSALAWAGLVVALGLAGAEALGAAADEAPALPVAEVRAGLRGWGETVFAGAQPERFEVEVLGVLRAVAPGTDYVLARLSGHGLEDSGVIAGMSGSPVWIDGRLVGAVAFAWPFASEAIAGITPIEAMRRIGSAGAWPGPARPVVSFAELAARRLPGDLLTAASHRLARATGLEAGPAVAWGAGGFSPAGLARLSAALPALSPVAVGRAEPLPAAGEELRAGSAVAALFVDGDLRLAATGTLTERSGDRVLAFGHPVAGLGDVSLPLATAEIVAVLPSRFSSFKLANAGPVVGEFVRDHAAGTLGRIGAVPSTVPLEVRVAAPVAREFHLRLARVPDFLPLLAAVGALGALDSTTAPGGVHGLDLRIDADLGARGRVALSQSFDGPGAVGEAAGYVFALLDFLVHNDLAEVTLAGLRLELTPWTSPRSADLVGAHAARTRLEPGEVLELNVDLRAFRGERVRRTLRIPIPADLPAGRYTFLVGDGASVDAARFALEPVAPVSFEQAVEWLGALGSTREIAVLGVLAGRGLGVAGEILPRLPASAQAIWAAGGGGGTRPLRLAIAQRLRFPEAEPVTGLVRLDVELRRPQPSAGEGGGGEEDAGEGATPDPAEGSAGGGGKPSAAGNAKEKG